MRKTALVFSLALTIPLAAQFPQPGFPQPMPPQQPAAPMQPIASAPVMVQPSSQTSELTLVATSPYRSITRTRRMLNELAAELVLAEGYTEITQNSGSWKTTQLSGLAFSRRFEKKNADGSLRAVEIAVVPAATGEYRIHVYAEEAGHASPDLAALRVRLDALLQQQTAAAAQPQRDNIAQHIVQLSYVQGDRAVGMLKALGYSTVEFTQTPGETKYDTVFDPVRKGEVALPVIVKLIDSAKTSLMDPFTAPQAPGAMMQPQMPQMFPGQTGQRQPIPDIGGTFLHQITTGEPQERLMILYDENDPDSLEHILNILHREIDVPARQVVISALIVEVDSNKLRQLGISFKDTNGKVTGTLPTENSAAPLPFTFTFDENLLRGPFRLQATLQALVDRGEAEILSNPSVLVLDGRQARIQIGQQVPVVNSTATAAGITSSVDYFPVGIVLNLRPRVSDDGTDVTMQVETIVSAVASTAPAGSNVLYAPTVDNRQVQTFVRVADSTPFIIGGLISSNKKRDRTGIPLLSEIPFLGNLFRSTTSSNDKREVIVVLTPHVVPIDDKDFSYVIPKDSDIFDSFGNKLFRNAYRIRSRDVFDLRFVYESDAFQQLVSQVRTEAAMNPVLKREEPFATLLRGEVPGESILVHRMLWEIIRKTDYAKYLTNDRIIFFQPGSSDKASTDFQLSFFKDYVNRIQGDNALVLSFDAANRGTPEHPFVQPKADVSFETVPKSEYEKRLVQLNDRDGSGQPKHWSILLSENAPASASPIDILKGVLILKRLLQLNSSLPLTINEFRVGRQIIFPTEEDIQQGFHVVDRDAAQLFYEVMEYYRAFETEFNATTRSMMSRMNALQHK